MRAVLREFGIPRDDAGLREIVDGFIRISCRPFPSRYRRSRCLPQGSAGRDAAGPPGPRYRIYKSVRLVVGIDRKIVALSGRTVKKMVANHVSVIRGPSACHLLSYSLPCVVQRPFHASRFISPGFRAWGVCCDRRDARDATVSLSEPFQPVKDAPPAGRLQDLSGLRHL